PAHTQTLTLSLARQTKRCATRLVKQAASPTYSTKPTSSAITTYPPPHDRPYLPLPPLLLLLLLRLLLGLTCCLSSQLFCILGFDLFVHVYPVHQFKIIITITKPRS